MGRNYQHYIYVNAHPFLEWVRVQDRTDWSLVLIDSVRKLVKKNPEQMPIHMIDDLACRMDHPEMVAILYGDV